jgi:UPF0042 nucleotide-binding protein
VWQLSTYDQEEEKAMITIYSFGTKKGSDKATDAQLIVDCRSLANPHFILELRDLDGRDERVMDYVAQDNEYARHLRIAYDGVVKAGHEKVAFSCLGGRHRSVAMAEMLAHYLRDEGYQVEVQHLALPMEGSGGFKIDGDQSSRR